MNSDSVIQATIEQTKPFRSRAQEATLGLLLAADRVRRLASQVAAREGLTVQQYNVLRILRGSEGEGLPTLAIAQRMVEKTPGITRLIDRLEGKGLVRRERCPEDRRLVRCHITEAGLRSLGSLDDAMDRVDDQALGMLSDSDLTTLIYTLEKVLK